MYPWQLLLLSVHTMESWDVVHRCHSSLTYKMLVARFQDWPQATSNSNSTYTVWRSTPPFVQVRNLAICNYINSLAFQLKKYYTCVGWGCSPTQTDRWQSEPILVCHGGQKDQIVIGGQNRSKLPSGPVAALIGATHMQNALVGECSLETWAATYNA